MTRRIAASLALSVIAMLLLATLADAATQQTTIQLSVAAARLFWAE